MLTELDRRPLQRQQKSRAHLDRAWLPFCTERLGRMLRLRSVNHAGEHGVNDHPNPAAFSNSECAGNDVCDLLDLTVRTMRVPGDQIANAGSRARGELELRGLKGIPVSALHHRNHGQLWIGPSG